jgi:uncharacterized protein (TIGR00251 family)
VDFSFHIRVQPGASKNEIVPTPEGVKVRLQAPAVEGKANKACIQFLSKQLGIPKRRIAITRGERARVKEITILDASGDEIGKIKKTLKVE